MGGYHLHKKFRILTPGIHLEHTSACTRSVTTGEVQGRAVALRLGREQAVASSPTSAQIGHKPPACNHLAKCAKALTPSPPQPN